MLGYTDTIGRVSRLTTLTAALILAVAGTPANASEMMADDDGVLNPSEYTLEQILHKVERGELTDIECIYGYEAAKHGKHVPARRIIRYCAVVRQLTQSMTLLAWMDENGYALEGGPDLVSAAAWDRRAAERGDSNAQYNYGLKLLRGRGVARDVTEGRRYIDQAAANGDRSAQELVADNYDLSNVVGIAEDRLHKSTAAQISEPVARTN